MKSRKHRLLLLNPPSLKPVFRDCYCSGASKGTLVIQPLDLLMQSGYFDHKVFQVELLDAPFERLSVLQTLNRISGFKPDSILSLIGSVTLENDSQFLNRIKALWKNTRLIVSGDLPRFCHQDLFARVPAIDGLLMDFSSPALLCFLQGRPSKNMILRDQKGSYPESSGSTFNHPVPLAHIVTRYPYKLPFFKSPRYYCITTSFGCPYQCAYCNTHLLGYRTRGIDKIIEELHYAHSLGYRSLYVRDATFLFDKDRTLQLFMAWERTGLQFEWICFSRPDLIDNDRAEAAASLGCCMMMLGVETFDESCLNDISRDVTLDSIKKAFWILRRNGIASAAQIIVGLQNRVSQPFSSSNTIDEYEKKLKNLLKQIDPDYLSLNLYFPRPGIKSEYPLLMELESHMEDYRRLADQMTRQFYLHPRSIFRQARKLKSLTQLSFQAKTAINILFK